MTGHHSALRLASVAVLAGLAFATGSAAPAGAAAATAIHVTARTLATFDSDARAHPENVAVGRDGAIHVSLHDADQVWSRWPDGSTTFSSLPRSSAAGSQTRANGIVVSPAGKVSVAVLSTDAAFAGVWEFTRFTVPVRVATLPATASPNGMSRNINGDLYIADDALGLIWRVPAQRSDTPVAAQVWTRDPLLTRKPGGTPYGANGTEISRGQLLIGNPSQQILVAIPITARGCAGKPRVVHEGPVWASIDDFDVAPDGSVVGANISTQQVQIIHPDGSVANLAGPEVGLSQPTAVTIDDRTGDLYVTNAAFYRPPGAAPASIVRLRVIHSKHADSHADTRPGDRRLR